MIEIERVVILNLALKRGESNLQNLQGSGFAFVNLDGREATFNFQTTVQFGPDFLNPRVAPVDIPNRETLAPEDYVALLSAIQNSFDKSYARFAEVVVEHYVHGAQAF